MRVTEEVAMDTIVENRIKAILDAHANNMIEGIDMGKENLHAMLLRAREPISDEDFERKEITLWRKKYSKKAS